MTKHLGPAISTLLSAVIVYICLNNNGPAPLQLFGTNGEMNVGLLIIGAYVAGAVAGLALWVPRMFGKSESNKRLDQWQAQDDKLAKQVQTDREKQLESKIATLETALQEALKRSLK